LAFSIDSAGVVKTWDILTGLCKESLKLKPKTLSCGDMQLIGGRLIIVWCECMERKSMSGMLRKVNSKQWIPCWDTRGLRITGDGSRVLQVDRGLYSSLVYMDRGACRQGRAGVE
jgi:hypothetical protein